MPKYSAPPEVELSGITAISFVANIQRDETIPILARHGLADIDPNSWYPAHKFMDALSDLSELGNMSSNFVAIGMEVAKLTPFPEHVKTLEDVLLAWDDAYKTVHRNHHNNIGSVKLEKLGDTHFITIHDHLYPDDFSYGIVYGFANRFLPAGTDFRVSYDPDLPQRDRDGAKTTVIHISW